MHHYVYRIENVIDGKIYVGKHSTENLDDGYMGSGKLLSKAIAKHGIENFRKHIIKMCESSEEAFELERQIVNEQFVADKSTYNLVTGGHGGDWSSIGVEGSKRGGSSSLKNRWKDKEWRDKRAKESSERLRQRHVEGKVKVPLFTGKHHSDAAKAKISQANSQNRFGEKNPMYSRRWVHNTALKKAQVVKLEEIDVYLSQGWLMGKGPKQL